MFKHLTMLIALHPRYLLNFVFVHCYILNYNYFLRAMWPARLNKMKKQIENKDVILTRWYSHSGAQPGSYCIAPDRVQLAMSPVLAALYKETVYKFSGFVLHMIEILCSLVISSPLNFELLPFGIA